MPIVRGHDSRSSGITTPPPAACTAPPMGVQNMGRL
jgi:hypothetical protein